MLSNPNISRIIHGESGYMEFFHQFSTRSLSSECSDFPYLDDDDDDDLFINHFCSRWLNYSEGQQ